jgi:hypothetical protein
LKLASHRSTVGGNDFGQFATRGAAAIRMPIEFDLVTNAKILGREALSDEHAGREGGHAEVDVLPAFILVSDDDLRVWCAPGEFLERRIGRQRLVVIDAAAVM